MGFLLLHHLKMTYILVFVLIVTAKILKLAEYVEVNVGDNYEGITPIFFLCSKLYFFPPQSYKSSALHFLSRQT